jgi:hypothetical protein
MFPFGIATLVARGLIPDAEQAWNSDTGGATGSPSYNAQQVTLFRFSACGLATLAARCSFFVPADAEQAWNSDACDAMFFLLSSYDAQQVTLFPFFWTVF